PHYDELIVLSKIFCRNKICQVSTWLLGNGHTQLFSIYSAHTKHQCRWLRSPYLIALLTLYTRSISNISITCTVYNGLGQNYLTSRLAFDNHTLKHITIHDHTGRKNVQQHL